MTLDPSSLKPGDIVSLTPGQTVDETVVIHLNSSFHDIFPGGDLLTFVVVENRMPASDPWVEDPQPRDHYIFMSDAGGIVQASPAVVKKMKIVSQ